MKHRTGRKIAFLYLFLLAILAVLVVSDLYRWKVRSDGSWLRRVYKAIPSACETMVEGGAPAAKSDAPPPGMSPY